MNPTLLGQRFIPHPEGGKIHPTSGNQVEIRWNMNNKSKKFSITFNLNLYDNITKKAETLGITTAQAIREASTYWVDKQVEEPTQKVDNSPHVADLQKQVSIKDDQLADQQETINKLHKTVEGLQQSLDQSQQLHALTQKNHETELAKIEGQGFLKRLKAVFSG